MPSPYDSTKTPSSPSLSAYLKSQSRIARLSHHSTHLSNTYLLLAGAHSPTARAIESLVAANKVHLESMIEISTTTETAEAKESEASLVLLKSALQILLRESTTSNEERWKRVLKEELMAMGLEWLVLSVWWWIWIWWGWPVDSEGWAMCLGFCYLVEVWIWWMGR